MSSEDHNKHLLFLVHRLRVAKESCDASWRWMVKQADVLDWTGPCQDLQLVGQLICRETGHGDGRQRR